MPTMMQLEDEKLFSAILRINSKMFGLILCLLMGLAIFIATNWLVFKGGYTDETGHYIVGPHLQLLSQFFIGYSVSFVGSFVGFAYGFACMYGLARALFPAKRTSPFRRVACRFPESH